MLAMPSMDHSGPLGLVAVGRVADGQMTLARGSAPLGKCLAPGLSFVNYYKEYAVR